MYTNNDNCPECGHSKFDHHKDGCEVCWQQAADDWDYSVCQRVYTREEK